MLGFVRLCVCVCVSDPRKQQPSIHKARLRSSPLGDLGIKQSLSPFSNLQNRRVENPLPETPSAWETCRLRFLLRGCPLPQGRPPKARPVPCTLSPQEENRGERMGRGSPHQPRKPSRRSPPPSIQAFGGAGGESGAGPLCLLQGPRSVAQPSKAAFTELQKNWGTPPLLKISALFLLWIAGPKVEKDKDT